MLLFCVTVASAQRVDSVKNPLSQKVSVWLHKHVKEQTYLHFDKPYYATGDTVYFKAYVTSGERHYLSDVSNVLNVELIGIDNKIQQAIKLHLANGLAWGDLTLPDTLAPGNYRIRAYTRWMLNDGNLFEQTIPVGSVHTQTTPEHSTAKTIKASPDLQFFPEGGQLVAGVPVKIAFKAVGANGLGLGVTGSIADNSGRITAEIKSSHLGMGYFSFVPGVGKSYKANVAFADGSKGVVNLPAPLDEGISLAVNNDSLPKADVKILANTTYYQRNKGKDYTLLIYSGGSVTTVPVKLDSAAISLTVLKRHLHTGVATITLFSANNEPLCERLIFVQNFDQLSLNLSADKNSYATREKVSIKLNAKTRADSAALAHFSVSVTDESKVEVGPDNENTILTNLLLTADLKGTVEQPAYYFANNDAERLKALDLVMLTHGYRRFEWQQVLDNQDEPLAYQPEKGLDITGRARNLLGASLVKGNIALINPLSNELFTTTADDKGNFAFKGLQFWDSTRFVLQASNTKGKNSTQLTYHGDTPAPVTIVTQPTTENGNAVVPAAYLANNEKQQEQLSMLGLGKGTLLKEVKVKAKKRQDNYVTQSLAGAGNADQVIHSKDIGYGPFLSLSLLGKLRGIGFANPDQPEGGIPMNLGGRMLVVVDGAYLTPSPGNPAGINSIPASNVETIEVLRFGSAAIYGMAGANGVMIITTKRGGANKPEDIISKGILPITVIGYHKIRQFYSPKYEGSVTYNHPDLRSTIYWQPELTTDKQGNASFDFYNADGKGSYRIVIEGVDENGHLGRTVYHYSVL